MLTMCLYFDTFVKRIADAVVLEGTKMPAVNTTQSLKILAESNIISIRRVAFDVPIYRIECPEISMMAIDSAALLQCADNKVGGFFIEEPRSVLITDSIKAINLFAADVFNQCGVEERCVGHVLMGESYQHGNNDAQEPGSTTTLVPLLKLSTRPSEAPRTV